MGPATLRLPGPVYRCAVPDSRGKPGEEGGGGCTRRGELGGGGKRLKGDVVRRKSNFLQITARDRLRLLASLHPPCSSRSHPPFSAWPVQSISSLSVLILSRSSRLCHPPSHHTHTHTTPLHQQSLLPSASAISWRWHPVYFAHPHPSQLVSWYLGPMAQSTTNPPKLVCWLVFGPTSTTNPPKLVSWLVFGAQSTTNPPKLVSWCLEPSQSRTLHS